MTDAPERIWTWDRNPTGGWSAHEETHYHLHPTEYVRADTIAALTARADQAEAALATARDNALEEAATHADRQADFNQGAHDAARYDEHAVKTETAWAAKALRAEAAAIRAMKGDTA